MKIPKSNQYETTYVDNNMVKVSVFQGGTGRLLYSVTVDGGNAEALCEELAAKGYIQRSDEEDLVADEEWLAAMYDAWDAE